MEILVNVKLDIILMSLILDVRDVLINVRPVLIIQIHNVYLAIQHNLEL